MFHRGAHRVIGTDVRADRHDTTEPHRKGQHQPAQEFCRFRVYPPHQFAPRPLMIAYHEYTH